MSAITVEGRRVYVATRYGDTRVAALKALGATWDKDRRAWWVGTKKRAEVERIMSADVSEFADLAAREAERQLERDRNNLLGRATFDGQTYYVVAHGENERRGAWVRLLFRDGSKSFFKSAAEVEIVKEYRKPQTLAGLQEFAEKLKAENDESLPIVEECWECGAQYRTFGNVYDMNMSCRRCG